MRPGVPCCRRWLSISLSGLSAEGRPSSPLTVGIEPENVDGHGGGRDLTHNPVSRANGPASERLTSSLTVARDLGKRSSAQRWAGPYSHGGSQRENLGSRRRQGRRWN